MSTQFREAGTFVCESGVWCLFCTLRGSSLTLALTVTLSITLSMYLVQAMSKVTGQGLILTSQGDDTYALTLTLILILTLTLSLM